MQGIVLQLVNTLSCAIMCFVLRRRNDLFKLAAVEVDILKTDQLRCQSEIIAAKDEVFIL